MGYRLMIEQAMEGADIEVWGDPSKAHDIVYVKDLAKILYLACECEAAGGIYNVGTGEPITLIEQVRGMIEIFSSDNKKSQIVFCPEKAGARQYDIDISKTRRELGYEPAYSYLEYLKDFKKEMIENRFKELFP